MCQFMYPGTDIMGERYCISQCNTDLRKPEGQMERCRKKNSMGGRLKGQVCADPGARTPLGASLIFHYFQIGPFPGHNNDHLGLKLILRVPLGMNNMAGTSMNLKNWGSDFWNIRHFKRVKMGQTWV